MLAEQSQRWLPHILYGAEGAHAEASRPKPVDLFSLPGKVERV